MSPPARPLNEFLYGAANLQGVEKLREILEIISEEFFVGAYLCFNWTFLFKTVAEQYIVKSFLQVSGRLVNT